MKRKPITNTEYKKRAKLLKKAGFISHYNLRKSLTSNQKRSIRRLWNGERTEKNEKISSGWGEVLDTHAEKFTGRTVSNKTARLMKKQGIKVKGNRVYIPNDGFDSIQIKNNRIIKIEGNKRIEDLLLTGTDLISELKNRLDTPLKMGEFVTVRISDNSPFRSVLIKDYASLLQYVQRWQPNTPGRWDREELIEQMSIVTFDTGSLASPKELKAKNQAKRKAKKKTK